MLNIYNYTPNELLGSLASFLLWQRWILFPMAEKVYKNTILKKATSQECNIFISFSLWSSERKTINETIVIGFEYPLFIFSYS